MAASSSGKGYEPPASFKLQKDLKPLIEEATSDNKELWLLRMPTATDFKLKDFHAKEWTLRLNAGNMGQFDLPNGKRYNLVKHDIVGSKRFVYIPTSEGSMAVRQVAVEVAIVRHVEQTAEVLPLAAEDPLNEIEAAAAAGGGEEEDLQHERNMPTSSGPAKSGLTKDSGKRSGKHKQAISAETARTNATNATGVSNVETVEHKKKKKKSV